MGLPISPHFGTGRPKKLAQNAPGFFGPYKNEIYFSHSIPFLARPIFFPKYPSSGLYNPNPFWNINSGFIRGFWHFITLMDDDAGYE
jgi:hypothetical protein